MPQNRRNDPAPNTAPPAWQMAAPAPQRQDESAVSAKTEMERFWALVDGK